MGIYKLLISFSLLFLLTGCPSRPMCVVATDTSAKRFRLKLSEGGNCELNSTEVTTVTFALIDKKKNPILWTIRTSLEKPFPSKGEQISELLYGATPKGFFGESAKKLQPGDLISVEVEGTINSNASFITVTK